MAYEGLEDVLHEERESLSQLDRIERRMVYNNKMVLFNAAFAYTAMTTAFANRQDIMNLQGKVNAIESNIAAIKVRLGFAGLFNLCELNEELQKNMNSLPKYVLHYKFSKNKPNLSWNVAFII